MMRKICSLVLLGLLFVNYEAHAKKLNAGPWLFELRLNNSTVPFIVNLNWEGETLKGEILNGKEKIPLTNITVKDDEVVIPVQMYEITMELTVESSKAMAGYLVRHNKNPKVSNALTATHGIDSRFPNERIKPKNNFSGKYSVEIVDEEGTRSKGVLVLNQKESDIHGSLLTPTGDYRYFEGYVSGDDFVGASFDGMFNYIIKGNIRKGMFEGSLLANYKLKISGKLDPNAELPDAYNQTKLDKLEFSFPDLNGKMVSLSDKQFKNRPVIVQFFGSWCPNCLDEMNYLIPWYEKNHKRGIDIIALSFERSLDPSLAKVQLKKVQVKKKVPYTLLLAGSTAEDKPMEKIKGLKNFISFPTTVFLNRKHEVVKIHAGFTGPGTGEFYEKWIKEFNQNVDTLLK